LLALFVVVRPAFPLVEAVADTAGAVGAGPELMRVELERTVEMVEVVSKLVVPPVVWVRVTGQIVVEV